MIDRDALRVQSAAIARARILAQLIYARLVRRTLGTRSALRENYVLCVTGNSKIVSDAQTLFFYIDERESIVAIQLPS